MAQRKDGKSFSLAPSTHQQVTQEFLELLSGLETGDLHDHQRFKFAYQRANLLAKHASPDPKGADDRRTAAIKKWRGMELRNVKTNVRIFHDECVFPLRKGSSFSSLDVVRVARRTVQRVLGEVPDVEVLYGTFTNGASTSTRRFPGALAAKFKVGADVTAPCLARFRQIVETCETWKYYREGFHSFSVVRGGSLFTVPKNSEIDRVAVKEPDLNMFCQKGVGAFIRKRLNQVLRVDLKDQTRNQKLAQIGSADGSLATLDLSSASDLISDGLVRALLPEAWFDLLNDIRSQAVLVDGDWIELNMFSSMGNAFTFELESLIFWALSNAVAYLTGTRGTISVYGDDIIIPAAIGGLTAKVLYWFGLKVNTDKSFWSGPFRESCGKHWFSGIDVTPFYVKEDISSMHRLIHFLNRLREWAILPTHGDICDERFYSFWKRWSRKVPTSLYGGKDLRRIDALVTLHKPRMRLVPEKKVVEPDPLGAYLQWLRAADGRHVVSKPLVTSQVLVETGRFRVWRNAAIGTVNIPSFQSEWIGYGSLDALSG